MAWWFGAGEVAEDWNYRRLLPKFPLSSWADTLQISFRYRGPTAETQSFGVQPWNIRLNSYCSHHAQQVSRPPVHSDAHNHMIRLCDHTQPQFRCLNQWRLITFKMAVNLCSMTPLPFLLMLLLTILRMLHFVLVTDEGKDKHLLYFPLFTRRVGFLLLFWGSANLNVNIAQVGK